MVFDWIETGVLPAEKEEEGYVLDLELVEHVAPELLTQSEQG